MLFLSETKKNLKNQVFTANDMLTIFMNCSKFQDDLIDIPGDFTSSSHYIKKIVYCIYEAQIWKYVWFELVPCGFLVVQYIRPRSLSNKKERSRMYRARF